ncbi:MAG: AAA family ATPase, partial [Chlamydiae bacterium]|nr:AAA family ATPase [Chlamydiota bacterium]
EEQGKYPVIFLTLKEIKGESWTEVYEDLKALIKAEFERHSYLLTAKHPNPINDRREKGASLLLPTESSTFLALADGTAQLAIVKRSLQLLSLWLQRYYQKNVYIFIDEYDAPVHTAYVNGYYQKMINFLRGWLGAALKDNSCLERAVVTGILRVARESIFSGLNNFSCHTLLDNAFSDKFGLLEEEVTRLLQEHQIVTSLQDLRNWYNGYRIGDHFLYNPWSVLQCLQKQGKLQAYWVNTSDNALIQKLLLQGKSSLKRDMEFLLQGESVKKPIDEGIIFADLSQDTNAVWALLFFSGYLTLAEPPIYQDISFLCSLKIPNQEIARLYTTIIKQGFGKSLVNEDTELLLLQGLTEGNTAAFFKLFQEFVTTSMSYYDIPAKEPERVYHAFVLGLLVTLRDTHEIKSNKESGYGRYDVCLIPKDPKQLGIIFEFKKVETKETLASCAEKALVQIEEKQYSAELHQRGITRILALGVAFKGKRVLIKDRWL